jgi:lipoate-protein ligase A
MELRLIVDGYLSGAANMARDEALALLALVPTLRAYRFEPPAVTLGRFQEAGGGASHLEALKPPDADLVRRPTGGRAILHRNDFTYSVIFTRAEGEPLRREDVFHRVALSIIAALDHLCIEAGIVEHPHGGRSDEQWCFESVFGVDIEHGGRKICGSAQKVFEGSVLQHGSLYLDEVPLVAGQRSGFITLREAGGRSYAWEEVLDAFAHGFEDALGVALHRGQMTDAEEHLARRLELEKYRSGRWLEDGWAPRLV